MKRLSFFGVSIAVVILVALGVWFVNRPKPIITTSPVATISNTFPESQSALPSLLVTPIVSNVRFASLEHPSKFQAITSPTQMINGSHLKTDATGRALIEGINTTVLDSNTEITLSLIDPQKNKTRLQLEAGNVWSRVKKLADKGEFYEIETQTAHASVRGTSFGLSKKGSVTTLYVVEGIVNFGTIPPETDDSIRYSAANVSAGKKAVLVDGALVPIVSDITKKDRQDPWFLFNNPTVGVPPSSTTIPSANGQASPSAQATDDRQGQPLQPTSSSSSLNEKILPPPSDGSSVFTETIQPPPSTQPPIDSSPGQGTPPITTDTTPPNRTIAPATPTSPELIFSSMSPNTMVAGSTLTATLSGSGFVNAGVSSLLIGSTRMTSFKVWDDSTIKVSIDAGQFPAGTYNVTVEGASNVSSTLSSALTVTRAPQTQTTTTTPLR